MNCSTEATGVSYTDGSRFDRKPEGGVVIYQKIPDAETEVISYHLANFATVSQAEMFGIQQTAGRLSKMRSTGKDIRILTDN